MMRRPCPGPATASFAENGEGSVATFTAMDPEGVTSFTWSLAPNGTDPDGDDGPLTVADAADDTHFDISEDGVLTFDIGGDGDPDTSVAPDFEAPRAIAPADANTNTYRVVVSAADAAAGVTGRMVGYHKITVMVTNEAEPGKVTWTVVDGDNTAGDPPLVQLQVGAVLAASATDGDIEGPTKTVGTDQEAAWQWYRGGSPISGQTANNYTVDEADIGSRLRVQVSYRVGGSTTLDRASLTSDYSVLSARSGTNDLEFDPATVSREVAEGDKGMNVGAPVRATGNHGAVNYALSGTDADQFEIDQKTGQIKTSEDLDYEETDTSNTTNRCDTLNSCSVTVTARDASGENSTANATVTIMVTNVDEKPSFSAGAEAVSVFEGSTLVRADDEPSPNGDMDNDSSDTANPYTAADTDGGNVSLTLMGADGDKFNLGADDNISFKMAPDYENPTDANGDNVYEVTVRVSDDTMYADKMVRVTVIDVNEDPMILGIGLSVTGSDSASVAENTTDVGTYMVTGPGADMATWSVDGDDAASFTAAGGELAFLTAPNYEMPRGMAMSDTNTNTYMVTVKATSGDAMDSMDVEVTVTNVDDDGTVSVMPESPMAGADLTAMLTDEDGGTANQMWTWETSSDGMAWNAAAGTATGEGTDSSTYTSVTDDGGMYVRAMVSYDDALGMGRMAMDSVMVRPDTAVGRYDTNGTPGIQLDEVLQAIDDLFNGGTLDDVLAVIDALFG